MHPAIEAAIGNARLEYPDFEPDAEWLSDVESAVAGEITFDEAVARVKSRLNYQAKPKK